MAVKLDADVVCPVQANLHWSWVPEQARLKFRDYGPELRVLSTFRVKKDLHVEGVVLAYHTGPGFESKGV